MSLSPAIPQPEIPLNDPRFFEGPGEDAYALTDDHGHLASRWRNRLRPSDQEYAQTLIDNGYTSWASKAASCHTWGSVDRKCPEGHWAHANQISCQDRFSLCCGRPGALLGRWLYRRDLHRIASRPHVALTLEFPVPKDIHDDARRQGRLSESHISTLQALATDHTRRLFARSGCETLLGDVIDVRDTETFRIRVAAVASTLCERTRLSRRWSKIAGDGARVTFAKHAGGRSVVEILNWVFAATESVLALSGVERANLRIALEHCRLIRTTGRHYRTMSASELAEWRANLPEHMANCPTCGAMIQRIERECQTRQPVDDIDREYMHVDWSSTFDPFASRCYNDRHISKYDLTDKSVAEFGSVANLGHAPPI